jgi:excisionase family DNA binding protein
MDTFELLQHKRLLRVDEAARILNVSRWTVYRWVEAGRLGATRIGVGSLRIFSETVAALIDHHCVGGPEEIERDRDVVEAPVRAVTRRTESGKSGKAQPRQQAAL